MILCPGRGQAIYPIGEEGVWHQGSARGLELSRHRIPEDRDLTIPGVFQEGFVRDTDFINLIIPMTPSAVDNPV